MSDVASLPPPQPAPASKVGTRRMALLALAAFAAAALSLALLLLPNPFPAPAPEQTRLVLGGEVLPGPLLVDNGEYLFPVKAAREFLDPTMDWDEAAGQLTVTTRDKVLRLRSGQLTAYLNGKPVQLNLPVTVEKGEPFLPLSFLGPLLNLKFSFHEETGALVADRGGSPVQEAKVTTRRAAVRTGPSRHERVVARLSSGEKVDVFGEEDGWLKVRTSSGLTGFLDEGEATLAGLKEISLPQPETRLPWKPWGEKISLVWEHVLQKTPDLRLVSGLGGINVVSPTWFSLADTRGQVRNLADARYVHEAHARGYQVWALVSNNFDPDLTHSLLQGSEPRESFIRQLLALAALYGLDGLNFDFENIKPEDRDRYTQLLREAAPLFHEQGLVLSVDVTVPSSSAWSQGYDRRALAGIADYIMVMTYDEHWSKSPVAGSVASLPWTENSIQKLLREVPADKLLLGIPFYTRLWEEKPKAGGMEVTSQALSMPEARKILESNNAATILDEATGQNFAEFRKGDRTFKVWLEDSLSLTKRLQLASKYGLAGVAFWRRGFEDASMWQIVKEELNKRVAPP